MSLALAISVKNQVTPFLRDLDRNLAPDRLARPIGQGLVQLFKAHFTALDTARANTLGGQRTHFYRGAARGTSWQPVAGGVLIAINQLGIAQRYFGGKIEANQGKALTIPADPEAYGRRARSFNDLRLVVFKDTGKAALVKTMATNIRFTKKRKEVKAVSSQIQRIMYWLVKSVTQRPDPTVLPNDQAVRGAAVLAVRFYIQGLKRGRGSV